MIRNTPPQSPHASRTSNAETSNVPGSADPSKSTTPLSRLSKRATQMPPTHQANKATACFTCLGGVHELENGDIAIDIPADEVVEVIDVAQNITAAEISGSENSGEVVIPMLNYSAADIDDLQEALDNESTHWSTMYTKPSAPGHAEFKKHIDAYVLLYNKLSRDLDDGKVTPEQLKERSNTLGTMLMRAVGLADKNGWTVTTRLCMRDSGEAYSLPSKITNWWNMGPGLVRGATLATLAVAGPMAGMSPMAALYTGSAINFTYVGVQLGFAVMLPMQNGAAQSAAVARQAQWGPLFQVAVESSACKNREGEVHKIRLKEKVQAEINELDKLTTLYGPQATPTLQDVSDAQAQAATRADKALGRIKKWVESLHARLQKAKDKGQNIGATGEKVLAIDVKKNPLSVLAAAKDLAGTPYAPSARWYGRTEKSKAEYDTYELVSNQLQHALDSSNTAGEGEPANHDPATLSQALSVMPPKITQLRNQLTWELVASDRYETLNVLTNQGHSRAIRNVLNLLAALFSLVGNIEDLATLNEDAQALLKELGDVTLDQALDKLMKESPWEFASFLTLLAQPIVYHFLQGRATARDQENKLAVQAQILGLGGQGQFVKDGVIDPTAIDKAFKGSMKTVLDNFNKALGYDKLIYMEAIMAFLVDQDHVTATGADPIELPKAGGGTTKIPCTFAALFAEFDACKTPAARKALVTQLGQLRGLNATKQQALQDILALYEDNLLNVEHVKNGDLNALLGPNSTLPHDTKVMLAGAIRYAQAPKHLPASDPRHAEVTKYLNSPQGKEDAKHSDMLAMRKGQNERLTNTLSVNQAAQKEGQYWTYGVAGSGGPTTVKALTLLASEILRMSGGYTSVPLNGIAAAVRLTGNAVSIAGSTLGVFLGYAYQVYILRKNIHRKRDLDLKVPTMAGSAVLQNSDRDFMTLLSWDRLGDKARVTNFRTLVGTPIPQAALPAPLETLKQVVMDLLPAFFQQAQGGAATLPDIPSLPYESRTSFMADIKEQMTAPELRKIFTYFGAEAGELSKISDTELETLIELAASAYADELERLQAAQHSNDDDDDDNDRSATHSSGIEFDTFDDIPAEPPFNAQAAIDRAKEMNLWADQRMQEYERDGRVQELVTFIQDVPEESARKIRHLRKLETDLGRVTRGEGRDQLGDDDLQALQQTYDLVVRVLRQVDPQQEPAPSVQRQPSGRNSSSSTSSQSDSSSSSQPADDRNAAPLVAPVVVPAVPVVPANNAGQAAVGNLTARGLWATTVLNDQQKQQRAQAYVNQLTPQGWSRVNALADIAARRAELNGMGESREVQQARDIISEAEMLIPSDLI